MKRYSHIGIQVNGKLSTRENLAFSFHVVFKTKMACSIVKVGSFLTFWMVESHTVD